MKTVTHIVLIIITLFLLDNPVTAQIPQPSSGTIQRFANFSSVFVDARNIDVWLPANYNIQKKYAVLYMHDGQMLFDSTITWNKQEWKVDETLTSLFATNNFKECIVVGIWNNGVFRHSEYFPEKPFYTLPKTMQDSLLKDALKGKTQANNYLSFIVKELKPFIDATFSTHTNQANTFIAGSSMGGLISMYAMCEYPQVFGAAACISTHWIGNIKYNDGIIPKAFNNYLFKNLPSPQNHRFYFDCGTVDLDSFYKPYQLLVNQTMQKKGYTNAQWVTKAFVGENHSEKAWSKRLHIPFSFLLKK